MFRQSENYTILHFGYEYTLPELAQYQHHVGLQKVIENIRHAPDFVLISKDKKEVLLVEVKYRKHLVDTDILKIAQKSLEIWNPSWLFVATPCGFFFEPCNTIVTNAGRIGPLYSTTVEKELQSQYLELLKEFQLENIA